MGDDLRTCSSRALKRDGSMNWTEDGWTRKTRRSSPLDKDFSPFLSRHLHLYGIIHRGADAFILWQQQGGDGAAKDFAAIMDHFKKHENKHGDLGEDCGS